MTDVLGQPTVEHVDPVCGMTVDPADAAGHVDYAGRTYYFCSEGCVARFKAEPQTFLETAPGEPQPAPQGTSYVCPMDQIGRAHV